MSETTPRIRSRMPATKTQTQAPADEPENTEEAEGSEEEAGGEEPATGGIRSRTPTAIKATTSAADEGTVTSKRQGAGEDTSWMKTGREAQKVQAAELEKNKEKERRRAEGIFMPFRFWIPAGKQVELVVLDEEPGPCFYEHQLQDPVSGKWDIYEGCPKEFEACPLCDGQAGGKESYYVMMLSVMVLDPYVNKNGITVPHSRKLMAIKTNDQPFFLRTHEREGTLRGVQLLMARQGKQDSSIGRPEFIARHSEADIMATFGHPAIKANDGRVLKQANADTQPFPYAKLWTRPSGADLRTRYGGAPPMGSEADLSGGRTIGRTGGVNDDLDSDIPF